MGRLQGYSVGGARCMGVSEQAVSFGRKEICGRG